MSIGPIGPSQPIPPSPESESPKRQQLEEIRKLMEEVKRLLWDLRNAGYQYILDLHNPQAEKKDLAAYKEIVGMLAKIMPGLEKLVDKFKNQFGEDPAGGNFVNAIKNWNNILAWTKEGYPPNNESLYDAVVAAHHDIHEGIRGVDHAIHHAG